MSRLIIGLLMVLGLSSIHATDKVNANGLAGINHFAIAVNDLNKSLDFYTKVLGFKISMNKLYEKKYNVTVASVNLNDGATSLELIQFHNLKQKNALKQLQEKNNLCPHIGLESKNFTATLNMIKINHIKVIDGPIIIPHDIKKISIVDPDNYRIDIGQLLK